MTSPNLDGGVRTGCGTNDNCAVAGVSLGTFLRSGMGTICDIGRSDVAGAGADRTFSGDCVSSTALLAGIAGEQQPIPAACLRLDRVETFVSADAAFGAGAVGCCALCGVACWGHGSGATGAEASTSVGAACVPAASSCCSRLTREPYNDIEYRRN